MEKKDEKKIDLREKSAEGQQLQGQSQKSGSGEGRRIKVGEGTKFASKDAGEDKPHDVSDYNKHAQQDANHLGHNVTSHASDPAKDRTDSLIEEDKRAGEAAQKAYEEALAQQDKEAAAKLAKSSGESK